MHDPTEGGVAGGLHELGDAANVGFKVYEKRILVPEETQKICRYFDVDPLQLISSGSLLIMATEEKTQKIVSKLSSHDIQASIIGEIVDPKLGRRLVTKTGETTELVRPDSDHLWRVLEKSTKT
jgi:hydrogenase maturation factor